MDENLCLLFDTNFYNVIIVHLFIKDFFFLNLTFYGYVWRNLSDFFILNVFCYVISICHTQSDFYKSALIEFIFYDNFDVEAWYCLFLMSFLNVLIVHLTVNIFIPDDDFDFTFFLLTLIFYVTYDVFDDNFFLIKGLLLVMNKFIVFDIFWYLTFHFFQILTFSNFLEI